jgi:hypothetical protein
MALVLFSVLTLVPPVLAGLIATPCPGVDPPPSSPIKALKTPWTINASPADRELVPVLDKYLRAGQERIEQFFGHPFEKSFGVEVLPSRSKFDEYLKKRWQIPRTERWMVALGVADKMLILTPRVWNSEAVEHDPKDQTHLRELVAHELVHVYHGQHNPTGDFDGMDDLGWLVEGLAILVSGQLDNAHKDAARKAITEGKVPTHLAKAWSGTYRYGVCGSMVRFVDLRYGRQMVWKLLPETKPKKVLELLKLSEKDFLQSWQEFVTKDRPG